MAQTTNLKAWLRKPCEGNGRCGYKEAELIGLRNGLGSVISMGKLRKTEKPRKPQVFLGSSDGAPMLLPEVGSSGWETSMDISAGDHLEPEILAQCFD